MSINVLWVDDEPQSLRYEYSVANSHGWQITLAQTASQAMKFVQDTFFDLIVLDIILPLDDFNQRRRHVDVNAGIKLIKTIQDPDRVGCTPQNVPILIITAAISIEIKSTIIDMLPSSRYYLYKPLKKEVFLEIVKELANKLDTHKNTNDHSGD